MSKLSYALLLLVAVFAMPMPLRAADEPVDAQKEKDIRKLLDLSGAAQMGPQMMDAVVGQMKKIYPQVPLEFWNEFAKEADYEGLLKLIVPVYEKHFTDEEILELIKFYESPIGKKLAHEQPLMMQESMQAGQKWGQELGMKIARKMQEKGYLKS
ncbi:MAG TPA: DUF2059 domain-containing protein [Tepidisphaeraceae bacterium]|jgi:hypothetical protein|nr:DUF2059 domain-containing protein [Tepidisphaeraceae bacterium]